MKLPYGLLNNQYIHISEVPSGRTDVRCPQCRNQLIAKKGKIKQHHFAHKNESCSISFSTELYSLSDKLPTDLPLSTYAERKTLVIQEKLIQLRKTHGKLQERENQRTTLIPILLSQLEQLFQYFQNNDKQQQAFQVKEITQQIAQYRSQRIAPFPAFHLLRNEIFKKGYTDGRQICHHEEINEEAFEYFYPVVFQEAIQCLQEWHLPINFLKQAHTVSLYEKELDQFHQFNLYFLEIATEQGILHKIGLTSRDIQIRLKEIKQALAIHFKTIQIRLLFFKQKVAFLENFFKQKYTAYQMQLGTLTEYFQFPADVLQAILMDFECIGITKMPERQATAWSSWSYFHSNGKLYGLGKQKSMYVNGKRYLLTEKEVESISFLSRLMPK